MALRCLKYECDGAIAGRPDMRRGDVWFEGDEHDCPRCGARYVIDVTDDYEDDAIAFLKPAPSTKPGGEG
jgi:hypothetical protein